MQVAQGATQKRRWRVELRVKFNAKGVKHAAFKGEVAYVGIFTVVDDYPEEKMYRLVGVDAPSILYSSIRELVALLTGRSSAKTVLLPTVSFIENVVVPQAQSPVATEASDAATSRKAGVVKTGKSHPSGDRTKPARSPAKAQRGGQWHGSRQRKWN